MAVVKYLTNLENFDEYNRSKSPQDLHKLLKYAKSIKKLSKSKIDDKTQTYY